MQIKPSTSIPNTGFAELFAERVDAIAGEVAALGVTIGEFCSSTGSSRATLSRWRRKIPATVATLDRMEKELSRRRAALQPADDDANR